MRNNVQICITKLTETYMYKHIIFHNTPDRINNNQEYMCIPLSNKFYDEFKLAFKKIVETASHSTEEKINSIVTYIKEFLESNGYIDNWDVENDGMFMHELNEVLTTMNRFPSCEDCRMIMGECTVLDNKGGVIHD